MKATFIRNKDNKRPDTNVLVKLCNEIVARANEAGFETYAEVKGASHVKIGMHGRSFRVKTSVIGYNARIDSSYQETIKGYKRTDVPTWEQRVEFNELVNDAFDAYGLSADIVSGNYTVRSSVTGARHNWPEGGDRNKRYFGFNVHNIVTEKEANELCDTVKRIAAHKEAQRIAKRPRTIQKQVERILK